MIARLTNVETQGAAARAAESAAKAQVEVVDATVADMLPLLSSLRGQIRAEFGKASVTVEDFGMSPLKPAARSLGSRVEAVAKSLATRVERHTLGKRQKAAVHGTAPPKPAAKPPEPGA